MGKPNYRVVVSFDRERAVHCARAPELEHLSGEGPTRAAAIAALEVEIDAQLANMLSHGTTPPAAIDETEFSGEIQAKVSRLLHRDLSLMARSDGVELAHLVGELLASALTARQGSRGGGRARPAPQELSDDIGNRADGGGNRRGGLSRGNFNSQILDDRANFIEYVRGLEDGNQANNHRRQHGGHGQGGHSHQGGHGHPGGHGHQGGHNHPGGARRRRGGGGGGGRMGPPGPGRDGNRGPGAPGHNNRPSGNPGNPGNAAPQPAGAAAAGDPQDS